MPNTPKQKGWTEKEKMPRPAKGENRSGQPGSRQNEDEMAQMFEQKHLKFNRCGSGPVERSLKLPHPQHDGGTLTWSQGSVSK